VYCISKVSIPLCDFTVLRGINVIKYVRSSNLYRIKQNKHNLFAVSHQTDVKYLRSYSNVKWKRHLDCYCVIPSNIYCWPIDGPQYEPTTCLLFVQ